MRAGGLTNLNVALAGEAGRFESKSKDGQLPGSVHEPGSLGNDEKRSLGSLRGGRFRAGWQTGQGS